VYLEQCDVKSCDVAMTSVTMCVPEILHGADMYRCLHACSLCTLRLFELEQVRLSFRSFRGFVLSQSSSCA